MNSAYSSTLHILEYAVHCIFGGICKNPHAGGDGALDADARLSFEEGDASGLGLFSGAPGVHHGRLQCVSPVAWLPAQRVGLRTPLDR